ncbi:MAG TPA: radical SAM/SPASM domain-containing protein [Pseudomonadales bacterium]
MAAPYQEPRSVDIEVTNRCNALCTFCPRDKMPPLGKMKADVFDQVLARLVEYDRNVLIHFAGFGEPVMHPELSDFIAKATSLNFKTGINTNAALLTEDKSHALLDAGLSQITFNIAAVEEDYEELYNLDFQETLNNIQAFLKINDGRCEVWGGIVENDINYEKIKDIKKYWKGIGIKRFYVATEGNRGGALSRGARYHEVDDSKYLVLAKDFYAEQGMEAQCFLPLTSIFISQEGQYLMCCHDWRKKLPLGSVFDFSVTDIDAIKKEKLQTGNPVCAACDIDPFNIVKESLIAIDDGEMTMLELKDKLPYLKEIYQKRDFEFQSRSQLTEMTGKSSE